MKPVYKITVDTEDESEEGVFTVSLVDKPAIRSEFVYMSEESKTYNFNEEKGEVVGAILIPDILIPRSSADRGNYYVTFSKETIEDIQYKMSKDNFFNFFNIDHSIPTDSVFVLETWIKESDNDKSSDYGLSDLPVGTMFFKVKIEDEGIKDKIKSGEINGFSVEIKASLIPEYKQSEEQMSEEKVREMIAEAMSAQAPKQEPEPMTKVTLSEDVAMALQSLVGKKDGYYQLFVSVSGGVVDYADMQSSHYETLMSEQAEENETETENLEESTQEVEAEAVEVADAEAEEPVEEPAQEESNATEVVAEVEESLSEEEQSEVEQELLSEQSEEPEAAAEPEPFTFSMGDKKANTLIDSMVNKYF